MEKLLRFFKHRRNILYFILGFLWGRRQNAKVSSEPPTPSTPKNSELPSISKATHNGKMTGFEPQKLKTYQLYQHELMFGEPGKGLNKSGFDESAVNLGQEGEINFAKALQKKGLLEKLVTFWSVHNLNLEDERVDADIDCVIVSGSTIWLVDLKFYASGNVIYREADGLLYTIDSATGAQIGRPKKMSPNMSYAEESFSHKFANLLKYYRLRTRVVLMPTYKGAGRLDNVFWPGQIKAVSLEEMLDELSREDKFRDTIGGQMIRQTFNLLLKR